jgi:hypothetical protein
MEALRIREKNIIITDIKSLKIFIEKNKEAITRIAGQSSRTEFDKKQIKTREQKNIEYELKIKELEDKLVKIVNGEFDEIFTKNSESIKETTKNRETARQNEKQKKKDLEKESKDNYYKNNRNNNDRHYNGKKDADYFFKICNSIPDYISRNLKEMPNNKGYIWRGIWCLGELPPVPGESIVLFERKKDTLIIREYDDNYESIFEKKGTGKKILISRNEKRKINKANFSFF